LKTILWGLPVTSVNNQGLDLQKLFPEGVIEGTVAALFVDFFQHSASQLKPRTYRNYKAAARTHVLPRFAKYPISSFGEDDVTALLSEVTKRSPQMVREVKKVISCAFKHGKSHVPGVKFNPALGIRVTVPKNSRDRWLTDDELETFFTTLPKMEDQKAADVYMLILASLCRPGEAASAKAEDLILINGERVWRIPDTKNGRDFLVPLQGPIGEILLRRSADAGGKGPLFWKYNSTKDYPEALKKANKEFRMLSQLQNVRPHDWRRTGRTHSASLEIRDEVGEALMNHAKEDLKRTYNLWEYWQERKAALKLWHSKMEKIRSSLALAA
jgi:integrase